MKKKILIVIGIIVFISIVSLKTDKTTKKAIQSPTVTTPSIVPNKSEEQIQEENKLEEEKNISSAKQYCAERLNSSKYYPIPEVVVDSDGKTEYKQNDKLKKTGAGLTQTDCKNIIDYLNDLSLKYPLLTIDIKKVIERKYWIGMNIAELSYSLGYPNKINTTNYGYGENQQWVYNEGSYSASAYYIYVENSKVISYQDF
ncbi:MAG: hypothetical protein WC895_02215 [Candidatus Shapirobacteria bacterium]|jgi:hypothetical protein